MALIRWTPSNSLAGLHNEIDRLFDSFFSPSQEEETAVGSFLPYVDIEEKDKELVLTAELPGLKKDDIKLTIKDNLLSISGEKKQEKSENKRNYHRTERVFGKFQRSFRLPDYADQEKIDADYTEGILTLRIPKIKESIGKEIDVKIK